MDFKKTINSFFKLRRSQIHFDFKLSQKIIWLRNLLFEMATAQTRYDRQNLPPTRILIDNTGAISLSTNKQVLERNKHISIRYHHIRDLIHKGFLVLEHIPSSEQLENFLTKPLSSTIFQIRYRN